MEEAMIGTACSPARVPQAGAQALSGGPMGRVVAASLIGAVIEWYDFVLYGIAAALVLNRQFFPDLSPLAGTLAAFGTYALGFGARPIGGLLFGHFGDRIGRKNTLVGSMLTVGIATALIGVLPNYESIGIWAPILLITLRLLQGVGLGGETGGAVLISLEHASAARANFFGGLPQMGVPAGLALANVVVLITASIFSKEDLAAWAWRVPFLISILLVGAGLVVRMKVPESPLFEAAKASGELISLPAASALVGYAPRIALVVLSIFGNSTVAYVWTVFTLAFGASLGLDHQLLLFALVLGCLLWLLSIPFWSRWADRNGRRRIYLVGSALLVGIAIVYFPLLNTKNEAVVFLAFAAVGLVVPIGHALQGSVLAELFPVSVRYSGMGWALGVSSVLGGASPLIAGSLFAMGRTSTFVSIYLTGACLISLVSAIALFRLIPDLDKGSRIRR